MKKIGDYLLVKQIGFGSTSWVHLAKHFQTHQKCCIKIIPKLNIQTKKEQEHLISEIKILESIQHPNLVKFINFFESHDSYNIVMEFVEGETLLQYINSNLTLTEKQSRQVFAQLISLVSFLHQKEIYHRDIKPENILIQADFRIKLIDFGLSSSNPNMLSTFCGSFQYAAPECILCQPYKGYSADMWSSGVILYVMITGKLPWMKMSIQGVINEIIHAKFHIPKETPPLCADLILHLILKDPSQRLTAEGAKKHQWLITSFNQSQQFCYSRRHLMLGQSSQLRNIKWVSSNQSATSNAQSNHYSFNLKIPGII
jgi:serine/threonine protein kinase